jgi:hypothetical protein
VGDGDDFNIRFWLDMWCRAQVLKETFLDLYGITRVQDAFVQST